jgi:hypothetical protein
VLGADGKKNEGEMNSLQSVGNMSKFIDAVELRIGSKMNGLG